MNIRLTITLMKVFSALFFLPSICTVKAQLSATIQESKRVFKTYPFSDPNPIPNRTLIYPYFRYDGFVNTPIDKEWKVIELENQFVKIMILPEVGGKIWTAWEKASGKTFIYNNHVVKFRDVAMRGPWTSGGIEPNYGIIGHTPNCATPVDYFTETKIDGSASCYIGTFDKLTQTYWTLEINLPTDKAYFTTRSFWHNGTNLEQPYYSWMNVGMPAKGNLQFIYPGIRYLGHEGEYVDWNVNPLNGKDISRYEQNDFGAYKSYHVAGSYADFFGVFYHDFNFGTGHYSSYDDKPGKKIWIWGLSRQGMIWEQLLTDTDGQYVEIQSGRLFNQASEGSMRTPFKNRGFAPYSTDEWIEYWFPVKGTKGFVKANPYGALNIRPEGGYLKWYFSPLQKFSDNIVIMEGNSTLNISNSSFEPLRIHKDSIRWQGDFTKIKFRIGDVFFYSAVPNEDSLSRPVKSPIDFDWSSPYAMYILGKEAAEGRDYDKAYRKYSECLAKEPYFLPALNELSFTQLRMLKNEEALATSLKALSIDTYDPASNFAYGLASLATNHIADAKDAFGIASASPGFRSASFTELAKLYFRQNEKRMSFDYASKALISNSANVTALQILAILHRKEGETTKMNEVHNEILKLNPLNHFVQAENFMLGSVTQLGLKIQQEFKSEVFLDLVIWYCDLGQYEDAIRILKQAPPESESLFWLAYLQSKVGDEGYKQSLWNAEKSIPVLVFPYRLASIEVMSWAEQNSSSWLPKYFLGLIHWNIGNRDMALSFFEKCGNPNFAPFYAAYAALANKDVERNLWKAIELDSSNWRYGKLLTLHLMETGEFKKALTIIQGWQSRFQSNDAIYSLTVKCLILNRQYKRAYDLLGKKTFLPNEGATENRQFYRESLLMLAMESIQSKHFRQALLYLKQVKQWPENLGVGKPYDDDIDYRLEQLLEAICLDKQNRKADAGKAYNLVSRMQTSILSINLLANALALKMIGLNDEGVSLLESWENQSPEKTLAEWCLAKYANKEYAGSIVDSDNIRLYSRLMEILKKN